MNRQTLCNHKISEEDFLGLFGCLNDGLSEELSSRFERINTSYHIAGPDELQEYILQVLKLIHSPDIARSRDENYKVWETGWQEHLPHIGSDKIAASDLKPKYFRPSKFLRYNKNVIVTGNNDLEHDLFTMARLVIFLKYLRDSSAIYEIGCGSCQNLLMLSDLFSSKQLYGLDWSPASVDIAERLGRQKCGKVKGILFDMTYPSNKIAIIPGSTIFTIHAMEQLGPHHEKLLEFIMAARPGLVLHYEPIIEFYNQDNLLDYLAYIYSAKRNYLTGYWPSLCKLEKESKIKILTAHRPYVGGVIHESSLIAWKPV